VLTLALSYGGRAELIDAARRLCARVAAGELRAEDVDEARLRDGLYDPSLPDPDLLVRTSGELRVSNFLLWQIAYAEIWVTDVLWPDFSEADLIQGIRAFQERDRRFGLHSS
jgi:undecaprenyl diphosphate synthase